MSDEVSFRQSNEEQDSTEKCEKRDEQDNKGPEEAASKPPHENGVNDRDDKCNSDDGQNKVLCISQVRKVLLQDGQVKLREVKGNGVSGIREAEIDEC